MCTTLLTTPCSAPPALVFLHSFPALTVLSRHSFLYSRFLTVVSPFSPNLLFSFTPAVMACLCLCVRPSVRCWPACWSVWQWGFRESAQRSQQPFLWGTSSGYSREERGAGMERDRNNCAASLQTIIRAPTLCFFMVCFLFQNKTLQITL